MFDAFLALVLAWLLALVAICMVIYFGLGKTRPCMCGDRLHHDCPGEWERGCRMECGGIPHHEDVSS